MELLDLLNAVNTLLIAPLYWVLHQLFRDVRMASQEHISLAVKIAHIEGLIRSQTKGN